jgi:hypothetical protein
MAVQLPDYAWIGKDDADTDQKQICMIEKVRIGQESGKQTVQVDLKTPNGMRRMDLYGDNLRTIIGRHGVNEEEWLGKSFVLMFMPGTNKAGKNILRKVIAK